VVRTLNVARPAGLAFACFTDGMAGWWPLATHSLGKRDDARIVFGRERALLLRLRLGRRARHACA